MAFFRIGLKFALAVSVILAIINAEGTQTITCQHIYEMRESDKISLSSCTIMTSSNYSDSVTKMHCRSCSLCDVGGGVRKSGVSKPHDRSKRQDGVERPLYASETERVLQSGHTYHLPCPVVTPDDEIVDVLWFKGSSCNPKKRQLILQHYGPPDGTIITTPGYRFSDTNYGLIIESANQTDSDRYWCKAYKESIGDYVEEFLDLIILDKTFPMYRWPNTVSDIQRVSLDLEEKNLIMRPVMSQTRLRQDNVVVYWSRLNTADGQSVDIVFPDVGNADGQYNLDASNNLAMNKFNNREEMYCCHVFQYGTDLRQGCVKVTWTAIQQQRYPVISGCGEVTSPEEQCDVKLESHQDFFQLECSVNSVYPKPEVSWSVTDCNGASISAFSTFNDWAYDNVTMTYNVASSVFLHNLPSGSFSCSFTCTSRGGAIVGGVESSYVKLSRDKTLQASCSYGLVFILTVICETLLIMFAVGSCLRFLRCRRIVVKHINEMPTCRCLVKDDEKFPQAALPMTPDGLQSENAVNVKIERGDEDEGIEDTENCSMMSRRSERDAELTRRNRDKENTWVLVGELVTGSFSLGDVGSGFQYIRDVIPVPTQNGGLVVIDSRGMHGFTSEYLHKYVNLYKYFPGGHLCVAYYATNKLLFGLIMGKIVIFDTNKCEVSTFSFVAPVGDNEVGVSVISVDSQGFVFAGDSKGKAISMFDPDGVYIKRVEINIEPNFLFAHTDEKNVDLVVTSESFVELYSVERKRRYPYRVSMGAAKYTINEKTATGGSFRSGGVFVRGGKLFVVNKLQQDDKNVQVLQHDKASGDEEHTFIVTIPEDEAATETSRGIKGVAFIEEGKVLVYLDDAIYIFEKGEKIVSGVRSGFILCPSNPKPNWNL